VTGWGRDSRHLSRLLVGESEQHGELIGYLLFDPEFHEEAMALGRLDAERWLERVSGPNAPWYPIAAHPARPQSSPSRPRLGPQRAGFEPTVDEPPTVDRGRAGRNLAAIGAANGRAIGDAESDRALTTSV
jgi:hypothetical protein